MVLVERRDAHQPVHSVLGAEQAVRSRSPHDERDALQPGLLARGGVDDLGLKALALGPLEVHAHEHLHPVLRLHPALSDRQRDHGVVVGKGVGEQQVELARTQLFGDRGPFLVQLALQVRIAARELVELDQVAGALLQPVPGTDLLAELGGLTRHLAGVSRVVPHARLHELGVELVGAFALGWKVKGAPSAARSVPTAL